MDEQQGTEQPGSEFEAARNQVLRSASVQLALSAVLFAAIVFVAVLVSVAVMEDASRLMQAVVATCLAMALIIPQMVGVFVFSTRQARRNDGLTAEWERQVKREAFRRDFETSVADAFEMAESETEALRVVERSLALVLPEQRVELLLADNSHAHLQRLVAVGGDDEHPGCSVGSPNECPAANRSRILSFPDSDAVNACPKLIGRTEQGCSALCMPVSVMGRTVGVIHTVGDRGHEVDPAAVSSLQAIANQAGARLGMLRILADSQLQASTDGLTGLLNRRALEEKFRSFRAHGGRLAVAMADLDHFKILNDTYGHETGDRALRSFAETLRATLREEDLVCRYGGEEFAILLPGCTAYDAGGLLERVRIQLRHVARETGLPSYTASFGVVDGDPRENLEALLRRADDGLFEAKHRGRDRIVINGVTADELGSGPPDEVARLEDEDGVPGADVRRPPDFAANPT